MRNKRKLFVPVFALVMMLVLGFSAYAKEYIGPGEDKAPDGTAVEQPAQPAVKEKVYEGPGEAKAAQTNPDGTVQGTIPVSEAAEVPGSAQAQTAEAAVHTNPYHHTCVEIDLTNQMLYAFDGETLVLQSPCVTGSKGWRDTSVGDWKVLSKETDRYLRGTNSDGSKYKSWVSYWMPFHGGQGMHDSSWRGTSHANYGGSIYTYDGSHGCVNLPYDMAQALFNFVHVGTPVHVHN